MKKEAVFLAVLMGFSTPIWAEEPVAPHEKPLWEAGVFVGAIRLPHYRGSDETSVFALPIPYFIYRGEIIRSSRDGVKGVFWSNDRIETALSFTGYPPVDKDNKAREGMPEIGAILEMGPGLKFFLSERETPNPFYVKAGVRAAVSIATDDLDIAYEGIRGDVKLIYRNTALLAEQQVELSTFVGVDFANREYNSLYYDVETAYVTETRSAYRSGSGYSGFHFSLSASKRLNDRWAIGAYYRWLNLSGTAYADSPLVKEENNHIIGCALICKLFQSKEMSSFEDE